MGIFLYNILGIIIGVSVIYLAVNSFKNKRKLEGSLIVLHSVLFIFTGVGGFFVPEDYQVIVICVLLALCITFIFTLLIEKTKDKKDTTNNNSNKKKS